MRLLSLAALLAACDPEPAPTLWYATCGDPACSGYSGPFDGVPVCTDQALGAACADPGATCDPEDACNVRWVCADEDPTDQEGGCPISRARHKTDIRRLDAGEVEAIRRETLDLPLATWRYLAAPTASAPRLGFIIDDRPRSYAVAPDGEHVDVYAFAAMAVATVQAQQRELDVLRARVAALEAAAVAPPPAGR